MDSLKTPVRVKSGGTQISRRTVARGVAWSAPIAAIGVAAPAFATSPPPPPVLASQCGDGCKHPGNAQGKTYHFNFCFKTGSQALNDNQITLGTITIDGSGGESKQAYAGAGNTVITVLPNSTTCFYIDATGFSRNPTTEMTLTYSYTIGAVTTNACALANVNGDTCQGAKHPLEPDDWPHDAGPVPAALQCPPSASTACAV